jgi:hypothetical protein
MPAFVPGGDLIATLTVLPTQGILYAYDPLASDFRGAVIQTAPFTLRAQAIRGGNRVVYRPNYRLWGQPLDSLSFTVTDSLGQTSPNTATVNINVQVVDYGGNMELTTPTSVPINVSLWGYSLVPNLPIADQNTDIITVTLSCNSGTLWFGNTDPASVNYMVPAQPSGVTTLSASGYPTQVNIAPQSRKLIFTGTIAACNAALQGIVYSRSPFLSMSDQINITINMPGHYFYAGTVVLVEKMPMTLTINALPLILRFAQLGIPADSVLGMSSCCLR